MLLNLLGDDVGSDVLARLDSTQAQRITEEMKSLSEMPPTNAEADALLGEFEVFLRFALAAHSGEDEAKASDNGRGPSTKRLRTAAPKLSSSSRPMTR